MDPNVVVESCTEQETDYGINKKGKSRFVVVAPHAAGDDSGTEKLARNIAEQLGAYLVINNKYMKPTNRRAESNPQFVKDFNKLPWSRGTQRYRWNNKHSPMKEFYDDIKGFAESAREYAEDGRAVVVYIHGMRDDGDRIGIDIGFGAKYHNGILKGTQGKNRHPDAGTNTGVVRAKREYMVSLKETLNQSLWADHSLKAGIGEATNGNKTRFAAWSRTNGIQYHAGTPDYSFQLEVSYKLRESCNIRYTSKLIADALSRCVQYLGWVNEMKEKAEKAKLKNIIELAISFSAMARVFEKGSTEKIEAKLHNCIEEFLSLSTEEEYHEKHEEFCEWFTRNIKTAERKKDGKIIKKSQYTSWGHAAKVIDVALKVCLYYCNLPSAEVSSKIIPWLNGAIDTALLNYLKEPDSPLIISQTYTLEDIDKIKYEELQKMIRTDIKKSSNGEISPVQYDDIKWRELNR